MTSRLLAWFGLFGVLALAGAGIGALFVVKDRIRVVVAADQVDPDADSIALLRDEVRTMREEVAALQGAIAENFEQLARAGAAEADRQIAALAGPQQAIETTRVDLQRDLSALHRAVTGLAAGVAAATANQPSPTVAASEPPATASPPAPPIQPEAVVVQPPPAVQPTAATSTGRSFLSFQVPDRSFHFDQLQHYTLVPELCRVGFDAKSTLHDFTGATTKVTGSFAANFAAPAESFRGEVTCLATALVTGVDGRDKNMREHLDTEHHPEIRFELKGFAPEPDGIDLGKQTAKGVVRGTMTIRGKSRELSMPVEVSVDDSKRLCVNGQTPLKLSDYDVPVPSQLGLISMQDQVVVWVALRARVQAGGARGR